MSPQTKANIIREAAKTCYRLSYGIMYEQAGEKAIDASRHCLIEMTIRETIETFLHDERIKASVKAISR